MTVGTLVDSNVLLDIMTNDPVWFEWSAATLSGAANSGPLYINPVVYSEVSIRFSTIEALESALPPEEYLRATIPSSAAFLAGKAFLAYRRNQGTKTSVLPDFFIGAHAEVSGWQLLTRDVSRYRTYFPTVALLAPS